MKFFSFLTVFLILFSGVSMANEKSKNPVVVLKTNYGDIYIELYPDKAPITVENFLTYVKEDSTNKK